MRILLRVLALRVLADAAEHADAVRLDESRGAVALIGRSFAIAPFVLRH